MNTTYTQPNVFKAVSGEDKRRFGLFFEKQVINTFKNCFQDEGLHVDHMQSDNRAFDYNPDSRFCDFKLMMSDKLMLLGEVKSVGVSREPDVNTTHATWNHNALFNEEERSPIAPLLQAQWPALRDRSKRLNVPYMIIMLIMPNIDRHSITMAAKAGLSMSSEAMEVVSRRARVLTVFGQGDQYGARVYQNYQHFKEWLKHHPDPIESLSYTSGHVDDFYESEGVFHWVPCSDRYLEIIHKMDKGGASERAIADHLNQCGAYVYGWDQFGKNNISWLTPDYSTIEEIVGEQNLDLFLDDDGDLFFDKHMIDYILGKGQCDPQILAKSFSLEDLNQLEGFLKYRSPRRRSGFESKSTRGIYVLKTELRAFEDWAQCLLREHNSRSFKAVPSFPSRESVASFIAKHPQGDLIRMALDCSRGLMSRDDFRATMRQRLCL